MFLWFIVNECPKDRQFKILEFLESSHLKVEYDERVLTFVESTFHMIAALCLKLDLPISVFGLETCSWSIFLMLLDDVFRFINSLRMLGPLLLYIRWLHMQHAFCIYTQSISNLRNPGLYLLEYSW